MAARAAIGFRAHSGWAAAVALGGAREAPMVIARRRIEMGLAQPYHASVGLEVSEAERVVGDAAVRAGAMATGGLQALIADLRAMSHEVSGCALLLASGRPLPALEAILGSHALIHTAEGEMFREALRLACRACSLPLIEVKERELVPAKQVVALGKSIGPPWRQDQKLAAAAAWLALGGG